MTEWQAVKTELINSCNRVSSGISHPDLLIAAGTLLNRDLETSLKTRLKKNGGVGMCQGPPLAVLEINEVIRDLAF